MSRYVNYISTKLLKQNMDFLDGPVVKVLCLPMQGTWVPTLFQEDPTGHGATKSMSPKTHTPQ